MQTNGQGSGTPLTAADLANFTKSLEQEKWSTAERLLFELTPQDRRETMQKLDASRLRHEQSEYLPVPQLELYEGYGEALLAQ